MKRAHAHGFSPLHDHTEDGHDVLRPVRTIRILPLPIIIRLVLSLISLLPLIIY